MFWIYTWALYGFKTYFNSVEEAEKYYLEISEKYSNAVRTK